MRNNHLETNKVMVVSWVYRALEPFFFLNIQSMYKVTWILLLNVKTMDEKIVPSEMITNNGTTKVKDEKAYDEEVNNEDA
jgi:hypothetical protein